MWGLDNRDTLKSGAWPKQPSGGYEEVKGDHKVLTHAAFESPVGFVTEIEIRLSRCSRDIKQLITEEIAMGFVTYRMLAPPAKEGVRYLSGWRRRKDSFAKFRAGKRHKEKESARNCLAQMGNNTPAGELASLSMH